MNPDDRIDSWTRKRRAAEVPPRFTQSVMARALRRRRLLAALAVSAACAVATLRVAAAFAPFIAQ